MADSPTGVYRIGFKEIESCDFLSGPKDAEPALCYSLAIGQKGLILVLQSYECAKTLCSFSLRTVKNCLEVRKDFLVALLLLPQWLLAASIT